MSGKSFVFALVPLSTNEKSARGVGEAVNGKDVEPSGVACLIIVIDAGKITASAESDLS